MTREQVKAELKKHERARALNEAKEGLESKMNLLLSAARDLERTLQRLNKEEGNVRHSDLFNWAVNDLNNVLLNLGMAELCRLQAQLEVTSRD